MKFHLEEWKPQEVMVFDENGAPVVGAVVELVDRRYNKVLHKRITGDSGRADSRWNGDPDSILRVGAPGFGQTSIPFAAACTEPPRVILGQGQTLLLTFTTVAGEPVRATFGVDLVDVANPKHVVGVVMWAGNPARFEKLKAGEYRVKVTRLEGLDFSEVYEPEKTIRIESTGGEIRLAYPLEHVPQIR